MLLLLRLQLFAAVFFSIALGDDVVHVGSAKFFRVVIHEPFNQQQYPYHFEFCLDEFDVDSDNCLVTNRNFTTHAIVYDYFIT